MQKKAPKKTEKAFFRAKYVIGAELCFQAPEGKKKTGKNPVHFCKRSLAESNRRIVVLQTSPLPLG